MAAVYLAAAEITIGYPGPVVVSASARDAHRRGDMPVAGSTVATE